ncbi:MAG: SPFH domain-containing protein [Dehalococcoidia bacterium]
MSDLVQRVVDFLLEFLPCRIVNEWEQGVRLYLGRMGDEPLQPGLWWFVPFLGEIVLQPVVDEVVETDLQTVTMTDGNVLTFSLAIRYRVKDCVALYRAVREHDDSILDAIRSAAGQVASSAHDLEHARKTLATLTATQARKNMRGWGVEIKAVATINLTTSPVLRLLGAQE